MSFLGYKVDNATLFESTLVASKLTLDKRSNQGRIKGGATGAIAPGPPLQGVPRDDIYLF